MSSDQNTPTEQNMPGSDTMGRGFGLWVVATIIAVVALSILGGIAAVFLRGLGARWCRWERGSGST
jgi:hypothetical protein